MARYPVEQRLESKRGCGWRKPGGLYLVADGSAATCCQLPFELHVCPSCGQGIKPTRGWTWITPNTLFENIVLSHNAFDDDHCPEQPACALPTLVNDPEAKAGLLWIGEQHYKTDSAFSEEASLIGISRRIAQIPRGFEAGKTWVFLAHRKVQFKLPAALHTELDPADFRRPAIFSFFKPSRIEYVIDPDADTPAKLERLTQRGITLVEIIKRQTELDYVAR